MDIIEIYRLLSKRHCSRITFPSAFRSERRGRPQARPVSPTRDKRSAGSWRKKSFMTAYTSG